MKSNYSSKELIIERLNEILGSKYMKQYMPKEDMITIINNQIITMRKEYQTQNKTYLKLKKDIDKLLKLKLDENDVESLFNAYKNIINISMELRNIFKTIGIELDQYKKIDYALYYEGRRYSTKELDISWLEVDNKGGLQINMQKATDDLEKIYKDSIDAKVNKIVQEHFIKYWMALSNMQGLHNTYVPGQTNVNIKSLGFNRGHAAEAYEEHLQTHHNKLLNALNNASENKKVTMNSAVVKSFIKDAEVDVRKWYVHEDPNGPDNMWLHLRHSLGNQAGTTAGDVGSTQVKAIINYKGHPDWQSLHLASLNTLKDGIERYGAIFSEEDSLSVSKKIVDYMTESITTMDRGATNNLVKTMGEDVYQKTGMKEVDELIKTLQSDFNTILIHM